MSQNDRIGKLLKLAYPDQKPEDEHEYSVYFTLCDQVYDQFPDKSTEFLLAVMCERISNQNDQVDYYDAHDVAIHYFMALSREQSEKEDLFAGKVKDALNLPDPAASIERMAHPELNTWYHLRYYDPMAKQKLSVGFTLDGVNLEDASIVAEIAAEIKRCFDETKAKIANTLHPDCEVKGCQHAQDVGTYPEHQCRGKCHYVNFC